MRSVQQRAPRGRRDHGRAVPCPTEGSWGLNPLSALQQEPCRSLARQPFARRARGRATQLRLSRAKFQGAARFPPPGESCSSSWRYPPSCSSLCLGWACAPSPCVKQIQLAAGCWRQLAEVALGTRSPGAGRAGGLPPCPGLTSKTPKCGRLAARGGSGSLAGPRQGVLPLLGPVPAGGTPCPRGGSRWSRRRPGGCSPKEKGGIWGGFLPPLGGSGLCARPRGCPAPVRTQLTLRFVRSPGDAGPSCASPGFSHDLGCRRLGPYERRVRVLHVPLVASWLAAWARSGKRGVARGSSWVLRKRGGAASKSATAAAP